MWPTENTQIFVDKKTDFSASLMILKRRKYSFLFVVMLPILIAVVAVFLITPVYRATATLLLEPDLPKLTTVEGLYGLVDQDQKYDHTQLELLKMRSLAAVVINKLHLNTNPKFLPDKKNIDDPFFWLYRMLPKSDEIGDTPVQQMDHVVAAFEKRLTVKLSKNSQIVKISFESISPKIAASVPNMLASAYLERRLAWRVNMTRQATEWLEQRLKVLKTNLELSELKLQDYMSSNNLVNVKGISTLTANELQELMVTMVAAKTKYTELSKRYGYKYPTIIAARKELKAAENALAQAKKRIRSISRKGVNLRELQRQVDSDKHLYDIFLARLKETSQAMELHTVNARIPDMAVEPVKPIKPKKGIILTVVLLGSLMFGFLMIFVLEALDKTIKNTDNISELFALRLFGSLPLLRIKSKKGHHSHTLAIFDKQNSLYSEAINGIRSSLILHDKDQSGRIVLITSTVDGEGKSTTASNLAAAIGKMQAVLLIDADLRQSVNSSEPSISGEQEGLSEVLAGKVELQQCIYHLSDAGIDILPCGRDKDNPLELLSTSAMHDLLEKLTLRYERIIIDAPSLQDVSDALMLSRYASSVLYVIESGTTHRRDIMKGLDMLTEHDAPIVGLILNKIS